MIMVMSILISSCVLLESGDITLPERSSQSNDPTPTIPEVDTGRQINWSEVLMASDLRTVTVPPDIDCAETVTQDLWLDFEDMIQCSSVSPNNPNLYYQAFEAQTLAFDLPEVICGTVLALGTLGAGRFDDHIAFGLNGRLLYASDVRIAEYLSFSDVFDWGRLYGAPMVTEIEPYCFVGCDEYYNNQSELGLTFSGNMGVDFDPNAVFQLLHQQLTGEVTVYAFGDNDPEDCLLENFSVYLQLRVPAISD